MSEINRLLNEWANDFEVAAKQAPTRLQGTVLMTRAQECREQAALLEQSSDKLKEQVRDLSTANERLVADLVRFKIAAKKAEMNGYGMDREFGPDDSNYDDSWIDDLGEALDRSNIPLKRSAS